jgi:hypothetical protein
VSLILAPIILFTTDAEWLRLLLMSSISTVVVVVVTLATKPTDSKMLADFYRKTHPPGFWKTSAANIGKDTSRPITSLKQGIYLAVTSSVTIYLLLFGFSRLMLPLPNHSSLSAIIAIVVGLASVALWFGRLRRAISE